MNKLVILAAVTATLIGFGAPAFASPLFTGAIQAGSNQDGATYSDLRQHFPELDRAEFDAADYNNDGRLDPREVSNIEVDKDGYSV